MKNIMSNVDADVDTDGIAIITRADLNVQKKNEISTLLS